jgi:hypothetical protein
VGLLAGGEILIVHDDALFGAYLDTIATDNAGVGIQGPGFGVPFDLQSVGRAAFLAGAAEDALFDFDINVTSRSGGWSVFFRWIAPGIRGRGEFAEDTADEINHD